MVSSTINKQIETNIDLFSDETLIHTEQAYQSLRDIGDIVYLSKNELYAVTTYEAVKLALKEDAKLISSKGVGANDFVNGIDPYATIVSDGETHHHRRSILMRPLTPKALATVKDRIEKSADELVQNLITQSGFCAVKDFATYLPINVVAEMVGLEDSARDNMLIWAAATFDSMGPMNDRAKKALEASLGLIEYVQKLNIDMLKQDSWAADILTSAANGEITPPEAAMMVVDYVAPSLDTTILASAHMLWRLATTDGAFQALKENPDLVPSIINESVRLASPIREFTRYAAKDFDTTAGKIPAGSRVAILYASANWDENHYPYAGTFKVDRNPRDHLGWGHGIHVCAGMHLARLEMASLLYALIRYVDSIEVGTPVPILNNLLQGFKELPARFKTT